MGAQYTVTPPFDFVVLPGSSEVYRTGGTVILSDASVALLTDTMESWLTLVDDSVADPEPEPGYVITSLEDVQTALNDIDSRLAALEP